MDRVLSLEEKNKYVQIIETIKDKFIKRIADINCVRHDKKINEISEKYNISEIVDSDNERIKYLKSEMERIKNNLVNENEYFVSVTNSLNFEEFDRLNGFTKIKKIINDRCAKITKRFLRSDWIEIDYNKLKDILLNEYEVSKYNEYDDEISNIKDKYNHRVINNFCYITNNFSDELKTNIIDAELEYARFIYNLYGRDTKMEMDAYLGKYLSPQWVNINSEFNKL